MRNAVLSGGNGLGGAAAGMPELVPVCGGGVCQWRGGFLSAPGREAVGPCGVRARRPLGGGLRQAWTPAASQRWVRLPEAKEKRAQGRIGGQAGTPLPSVVSEVSNHKAPAERERRALIQAMGKAARLRKHRH